MTVENELAQRQTICNSGLGVSSTLVSKGPTRDRCYLKVSWPPVLYYRLKNPDVNSRIF